MDVIVSWTKPQRGRLLEEKESLKVGIFISISISIPVPYILSHMII